MQSISASNLASHDMTIWSLVSSSDIVGKIVIFSLVICSIISWSILFEKYFQFKNLLKRIKTFEEEFWSGQILDELYNKFKGKKSIQPLSEIFITAIEEWKHKENEVLINKKHGCQGIKERISYNMELTRNKELEPLQKGLSFLATIGSIAPFIGLAGTVWGIMHSLQSIATTKNTALVVVAPGMAEALFATALGLFVAIPAVIFYNYLSTRLLRIENHIDDFIIEINTILSRAIDNERI